MINIESVVVSELVVVVWGDGGEDIYLGVLASFLASGVVPDVGARRDAV